MSKPKSDESQTQAPAQPEEVQPLQPILEPDPKPEAKQPELITEAIEALNMGQRMGRIRGQLLRMQASLADRNQTEAEEHLDHACRHLREAQAAL